MQDTELFLSLAEIAGVFVGFGALIAVRSGGASEPLEVGYTRGMVSIGVLTVVAALAPVILSRYSFTEHEVLALSSALALVGFLVFAAAQARTPEYRTNVATELQAARSRRLMALSIMASTLSVVVFVLALIIIILGVAPELESAIYSTLVVLILLWAAWLLLELVFSQRNPTRA